MTVIALLPGITPRAASSSAAVGNADDPTHLSPRVDMTDLTQAAAVPDKVLADRAFKQAIITRIANKFAKDYELVSDQFEVQYVEKERKGGVDFKGYYLLGGVRPQIIMSLLPTEPDFEWTLRNALMRVKEVLRSKALVRFEAHVPKHWITELVQETNRKLLPPNEYTVEIMRKVVIRHTSTGLTSTQECIEGTKSWNALMWSGKVELSRVVSLARKLDAGRHEVKNEAPQD